MLEPCKRAQSLFCICTTAKICICPILACEYKLFVWWNDSEICELRCKTTLRLNKTRHILTLKHLFPRRDENESTSYLVLSLLDRYRSDLEATQNHITFSVRADIYVGLWVVVHSDSSSSLKSALTSVHYRNCTALYEYKCECIFSTVIARS